MQHKRLNPKTLLLVIGLIGTFIPLMAVSRVTAQSSCTTWDFTTSQHTANWSDANDSGYPSIWTLGTGYQAVDDKDGSNNYHRQVQLNTISYPSTTLASMTIVFDMTAGAGGSATGLIISDNNTFGFVTVSTGTLGDGSGLSYTWTGSRSGFTQLSIRLESWGVGSPTPPSPTGDGGSATIRSIELCAAAALVTATPTITPSPTPTISPSAAPPETTGTVGKTCELLGIANSSFVSLPGNWQVDAGAGQTPPTNPAGSTQGLYLLQGSATLPLTLDPHRRYTIYFAYHILDDAYAPDTFRVSLGGSPAVNVDIAATLSSQTYTIPDSIYQPNTADSNIYDFTIAKTLSGDGSPGLIVDYACVSAKDVTADGSAAAVPAVLVAQCKNCTYRPVGDLIRDIPQVIAWIWCGISQLWDCVAKALLAGMWKSIVAILTLLSFIRIWAGLIIKNGGTWVTGNISAVVVWFTATILNIIISIYNAISQLIQNLGIANFLNGIVGLITGFGTFLSSILDAVLALVNGIGTAISVIGYWIGRAFDLAYAVIAFIPGVVASIVVGFNNTNTIPAWAAACNDSNTLLYYPCLGMYVLDNTIFDGPVYLLIPVAMGFMGFNTLLWAVQQVKHSFEEAS